MRSALSRLLVLGAMLAVPSAAGAESIIPSPAPEAGPVLAGTRAIWATYDYGGFDVRQASSRRVGSTLARFRSGNVRYGLIPELAASPKRTLIVNASGDNDQPWAS